MAAIADVQNALTRLDVKVDISLLIPEAIVSPFRRPLASDEAACTIPNRSHVSRFLIICRVSRRQHCGTRRPQAPGDDGLVLDRGGRPRRRMAEPMLISAALASTAATTQCDHRPRAGS